MRKSLFKMSEGTPQSWLHKLRVNIRRMNSSGDSKMEKGMERTISLPRNSYYQDFTLSGGSGFESARGPNRKDDKIRMDKKKKQKTGRKSKTKLLRSKSNNSRPKALPVTETRVSTGCICRAKLGTKGGRRIVKKNKVLEKSFEVFEMDKVASPCRNVDLTARQRIKGCHKDYYDSSRISFDGAVMEEKQLVESLPQLAATKSNDKLRTCSALCCACRLSFLESFNESDDSMWDVHFWSEEEEVEVPFFRNSDSDYDRLVSDMKVNCSMEDLKESAATLSRRRDAESHAQVQAKLSQMIRQKGVKNESSQNFENLGPNSKQISGSVELQTREASCGPETASEGYNFRKMCSSCDEMKRPSTTTGGYAKSRKKIDRGGSRHGDFVKPTDEKVFQKCKSDDKYESKGMRKISQSFPIVKCSYDPRRDFTESMVEMIMENEICNSHDLCQLLHCYISLNSDEYKEIILDVFEHVCSELLRVNL